MKMNFSKKFQKGFTLIELLVVVAIIGVLASVVLASLNSARAKGSDAAVKANLSSIRAQAEVVYDSNNCYADGVAANSGCSGTAFTASGPAACDSTADILFAEPTVAAQVAAAKSASGGASGLASCSSTGSQTAWAIAVPLKSDTTKAGCVDSTGKSKQVTENTATPVAFTQTSLNAELAAGACVE